MDKQRSALVLLPFYLFSLFGVGGIIALFLIWTKEDLWDHGTATPFYQAASSVFALVFIVLGFGFPIYIFCNRKRLLALPQAEKVS